MIRINLLPVRQIKQRIRTKNEVLAFASLFCLLLAALALVNYIQNNTIASLKQTQAQLRQEKAKYQNVLKQIEELKRKQTLLATKLKVIKDLKANSQLPVRVLDEIARRTPSSRMWLKSLTVTSGAVSLSGIALDNATIAQYMDTLDAGLYFSKPELKSSSMTVVANQKLKSFSLSMATEKPTPTETTK